MSTQEKLIQIRTRKLGLLVLDARNAAGKTVEQCASAMGVSPDQYKSYEAGEKSPSLPEVEGLAFYLNLPLEQFWGHSSLSGKPGVEPLPNLSQVNRLRQRVISPLSPALRLRVSARALPVLISR
jgi:transcriptional regulator with XRE-family HTH domain